MSGANGAEHAGQRFDAADAGADRVLLPGGGSFDKVTTYGWSVVDRPGRFRQIDKADLQVDHEYQRLKVGHARINEIAAEWSWAACGALLVAERADGSFWVFDGQHRKLAADKRSDIQKLPCLVFQAADRVNEAKGFLRANVGRGPVRALDKFNAQVISQEPTILAVKALVEGAGYHVGDSSPGTRSYKVKCIATLTRLMGSAPKSLAAAWDLAVALYDGHTIHDRVISGLCALDVHLRAVGAGSIAAPLVRGALLKAGFGQIEKSIAESAAYHGSGDKSAADGILRVLNKGRSTRRLPGLYEVAG